MCAAGPPKAKPQKMTLGDFLGDKSMSHRCSSPVLMLRRVFFYSHKKHANFVTIALGSWADDVEESMPVSTY